MAWGPKQLHRLLRLKAGPVHCYNGSRYKKMLKTTNRVHPPPTFLFKYTFRFQKTVVTCKSSANLAIAIVKPMPSPYSL